MPRAAKSNSQASSYGSTKARAKVLSQRKKQLPPLWKHQKKTLRKYLRSKRVLDASDPGTGKTRVALEAFYRRWKKKKSCALILAPKSLLESAWGEELIKFFPELKFSVAYAENRRKAFEEQVDVYLTNTDAAKWLAEQNRAFFDKFDTLIIDEITSYKHRTSQRSKAIGKIAKFFEYRAGLTGTPNSNSITDIWHQLYILDDGERLGTSFFKFRSVVCTPVQIGPKANHLEWRDKEGSNEAVSALIEDIAVRNDFSECMDIPENFTYSVPFTMNRKHAAAYFEMQDHAILELENDEVSAVHAAALRQKLLQIASGAVYSDNGYAVLDTSRYELILDLVEQREHSIVFFNWKHQKDQLAQVASSKGLSYEVIDGDVPVGRRKEIVAAYQKGRYQTLFLNPETGAHGLTLTKGTCTIWSSPIYRPDIMKQGIHRIYRGGQTKKTETIFVEARGTVEKEVFARLLTKNTRMVSLLELLKSG